MRAIARAAALTAALAASACVDPLLQAAMLGRADQVSSLLDPQRGPADPDKVRTALELAAQHGRAGHAQVVRVLRSTGGK